MQAGTVQQDFRSGATAVQDEPVEVKGALGMHHRFRRKGLSEPPAV